MAESVKSESAKYVDLCRPWTDEEKAEWDEHPEHFFATSKEFERAYWTAGKGALPVPPGTRVVIFHSTDYTAHSDGEWAITRENDLEWWLWAYRSREDSVALCKLMQWEIIEKEGNHG
jgi:hypothetical protein